MSGVHPSVQTPAHVVDDSMGVAIAEIGVEPGAFVGLVVAIGVLKEPDVRRRADNDPALVKHAAGGELDLVGKNGFLVHDAVTIGVAENGDAIERIALILSRLDAAAVLPGIHIGLAQAIRILRCLNDPQATFCIPVNVHGLVDQRLRGDEREVELRMHFEMLRQFLSTRHAAFHIAERITQLVGLAEFVHVLTLSGPGDAAQDGGADAVVAEVFVVMAGDAGEGAISDGSRGRLARIIRAAGGVHAPLIGPHLRLNVVDVHGPLFGHGFSGALLGLLVAAFDLGGVGRVSSREDFGLGQEIHVVVDFVVDVEIRYVPGDRVLAIGEVETHRSLKPLRLPEMPGTADDCLEPVMIL